MGDARVIMAEADAAIECGRAEPDRPAFLAAFENAPEAHVIAAIGVAADRLLEGEILPPIVVIQMADRRPQIGPVEQHAADNLDARAQSDRISRIPAGRIHAAEHIRARADQADIDRVARDAACRARDHGHAGQLLFVLLLSPEQRQHEIGDQNVAPDKRGCLVSSKAPHLIWWARICILIVYCQMRELAQECAGLLRSIARSRCGVTGSCVTAPGQPSASSMAAAMAAPAALAPPSPAPLRPSELSGLGASSLINTSTRGTSRALGMM